MKLRFQADADLNDDIVKGVLRREPRVDFRTAVSARLRGLTDEQVLTFSAEENRVLVSHDRKTMPRAFGQFISKNVSPGLIIVSQKTDLVSVIDGILLVWLGSEAEEWKNRIFTIPF